MKTSMSAMARAEACPPSTFLPRVESVSGEAAARGNAIHAYLRGVHADGEAKALESVPESYRAECAAIDVSRLPHVERESWAVEVGLAWDWEQDRGRELFRGSSTRDYSGVTPTELPGTADVLGVTDAEVVVLDVKTGWGRLGPPGESLQLLSYAVAAARAYGRPRAVVGWIRVLDETPRFELARLDELALDMAADRLRRVIEAAQGAELLHQADPALTVPVQGPHCRYCAAWRACQANTAMVRELAELQADALPVLDAETAPKAWVRLEAAELVLGHVRKGLEEYARTHPIDLPDGDKVGLVSTQRERIDPLLARKVLGEELFEAAVERREEVTKAALKRALRARLAPGQKITHVERDVLAGLRDAAAISVSESSAVKRFTPKAELDAGAEEPAP